VLPLCGRFRYGSSCVSLRPFVRSVTALRAFRYGRSCVPLRLFVRLGAHLANWPCIAFGCPSCQLALPCVAFGRTSCELALRCVRAPNLGEAVLKNLYLQAKIGSYPSSGSSFCLVLPLCGRFRYGSSCVSLRPFVRSVTALRAFPYGRSCQPALHCIWVPLLPTRLALPLVAQPWPGSSCVSLRLFVRLGAHVAKSPCVAFGRPSCELTLRCVRAPNLGEVVLKNLPPSQNWFLSVLRLVFLPSAPLCGRFRYGSSCVSLRPFVRFVTALRAFGRPSCRLVLHFVWVPLLPTRLALPLVAQPWPVSSCVLLRLFVRLGAHVAKSPCVALGHPSCELALRCVRAPNLGEAVLKNLPPSQNWFLSVIPLVFLPSAPFCGRFRYGSSCVSLRPFVRFVAALRAARGGSSCVSLRLFVRLGAHLANWPCIAFGCPSFQLPLPCPWSGSSCVSLRLFVRLGAHLANSPCVAFGRPTLVRPY
jgi:hypothetical protein